jgi:hypothetical protein
VCIASLHYYTIGNIINVQGRAKDRRKRLCPLVLGVEAPNPDGSHPISKIASL